MAACARRTPSLLAPWDGKRQAVLSSKYEEVHGDDSSITPMRPSSLTAFEMHSAMPPCHGDREQAQSPAEARSHQAYKRHDNNRVRREGTWHARGSTVCLYLLNDSEQVLLRHSAAPQHIILVEQCLHTPPCRYFASSVRCPRRQKQPLQLSQLQTLTRNTVLPHTL